MTHDETVDFLDVLGRVFVDCDASEDPDADDHDDEPEVEEVHKRGGLGCSSDDLD